MSVDAGLNRGRWWIPLILLVVSIIGFWILPSQIPKAPIKVEFTGSNSTK